MSGPGESLHQDDVRVHPDRAIAALAAAQHGVVSRRQLLDAGLTRLMIQRRLETRRLLPFYRGVYAVGHRRLRREGAWLAAVLAVGRGAALSHREAAALHELRRSDRPTVDVTVAAQRRVSGLQIHRVRVLEREDVTRVDGIPVTTVARTLVDLAAVVSPHALRKALEEAERSHRLDVRAVEAAMARTRGRNGRSHERVRRVLSELASTTATITRSTLEDSFLALLDAHGLARPQTNASIDGIEVDAMWPAARLVVELDGWEYHRTRHAFQRDRDRANDLTANGWTVLRFTHADVVERPAATARKIAQAAATSG
jgi:very-short-patch-repair endonuclease